MDDMLNEFMDDEDFNIFNIVNLDMKSTQRILVEYLIQDKMELTLSKVKGELTVMDGLFYMSKYAFFLLYFEYNEEFEYCGYLRDIMLSTLTELYGKDKEENFKELIIYSKQAYINNGLNF